MTVSTELSHEEYTGNGVTTDFDFRFRIFEAKHLVVSVAEPDGTERILTNGTDYTLRGVGSYRGGKVILKMPLATGWKIGIARDLPAVQETDLRNQGKFFAEVHEDAFDYLTMLIQKSLGFLSLCLRKPSFISDHYDAKGNKISNLGKPVKDGDAVDLATMNEHISAKDKRSLRVADKDIPALPGTSVRRNKQLGFDNNGMPLLLDPAETGALGYVLVDSFEKGAVITSRYQALHWLHNGEYYRWDGALPKTVSAGSTPESAGGVGVGEWIGVGGASANVFISKYSVGSSKTEKESIMVGGVDINYTVTTIDPFPYNLEVNYGEGANTLPDGRLKTKKKLIHELYRDYSGGAMFNASAFVTDEDGEHAYPVGLQIANGVAYQDFNKVSQNQYDNKLSILVMKDGSLRLAKVTDNKTAQDYVNEGAWLSLGWHLVSIWGGEVYQPSTDPSRSARTVFGRINGKEYAIFQSEGASGKYGLTSTEMEDLLLSLGFTEAVQLDGGGSVQSIWNNSDLIKSSDLTPRKIGGGVLVVKCNTRDTTEHSDALIEYIAGQYGIDKSTVSTPRHGMSLAGIKAIYDPKENRIWMIPPLNGELVSFNPPNIITTLTTQNLGGHNANVLNFFKNKAYTFTAGFTLKYANETIVYNGTEYRWGGALPKTFTAADNPVDSPTSWINVGSNSIVSQSSGTSKTVVMSQDAVTKMVAGVGVVDVTASRAVNAEYANSSDRVRTALIQGVFTNSNSEVKIIVGGVDVFSFDGNSGTGVKITAPIPPNAKYRLVIVTGNFTVSRWVEYQ